MVGECAKKRTGLLWPRLSSFWRSALRASQVHRLVVRSSGNITKSSVWLNDACERCICWATVPAPVYAIKQRDMDSSQNFTSESLPDDSRYLPFFEKATLQISKPSCAR